MRTWINADYDELAHQFVCRYAGEQTGQAARLRLDLQCDGETPPALVVQPSTRVDGRPSITPAGKPGCWRVEIAVLPPDDVTRDDEVGFTVRGDTEDAIPACRVILRRSTCKISSALVERHQKDVPVRASSRAALLWHSWNRFQEVVGLKRFTSGKSGSDVLVFRPKLREPDPSPDLEAIVPGVISESWGSWLLVKTGAVGKVREEWQRFQLFLKDRLHPFMSRCEEYLDVRPDEGLNERYGRREAGIQNVTIIGSFLGGDLVRAEAFAQILQGSAGPERCEAILTHLFEVLSNWYDGAATRPLRDWYKVFRDHQPGQPLKLFGQFDFSNAAERERFGQAASWDIPFIQEEHLRNHLLGKGRSESGLLHRLMEFPVRFSVIHGDLHILNVLSDEDNVWLLDFGETCVAPTLFDFAKLEVYLRFWGLRMSPEIKNFEDAAFRFESLLLDNMTGSEGGLESVVDLAGSLGAQPRDLAKAAHCIACIRRHALRYGAGSPDRRDYLAVLYLTALQAIRFAGGDPNLAENCRLLVSLSWVLEDVLSRLVGMEPFDRGRAAFDARALVTRTSIARPGAPGRIVYLMNSGADREALELLAATRGVMQNDTHHLDVFEHTILVLAYLERLIEDPIAGLTDPQQLDAQVARDLLEQGIRFAPGANRAAPEERLNLESVEPFLSELSSLFQNALRPDVVEGLKWGAVFHDIGKPATRCLNEKKDGVDRVQFLGHEVYGHMLARGHLESVFGERLGPQQKLVEHIILRHHDHHTLVNQFLPKKNDTAKELRDKSENLERIRQFVKSGFAGPWDRELSKALGKLAELVDPARSQQDASARDGHALTAKAKSKLDVPKYFPLVLLHGFADTLACRGPAAVTSYKDIAELDLLMLVLFQHFAIIKCLHEQPDRLTTRLDEHVSAREKELGDLKKSLVAWCRDQILARWRGGDGELTREEVIHKAQELDRQRIAPTGQ